MIEFHIFDKFRPQFELLAQLFPIGQFSPNRFCRLNEIYQTAECKWSEKLERLKGIGVKYLLIAEAPRGTMEVQIVSEFLFDFLRLNIKSNGKSPTGLVRSEFVPGRGCDRKKANRHSFTI